MAGKIEILLVEDNRSDAFLFRRALRNKEIDSTVHTVRDGVEALEFLFELDRDNLDTNLFPRVIFLDLKLPRLNGMEVLEKIKSDKRTCSIPVVVLTSSSEESDLKKAYELGVNSYLVKPVDMNRYSDLISNLTNYWLKMNRSINFTESK